MRLAVLAAADSWYLHDLRRAAGDRHEVCGISFRDLAGAVDNASVSVHSIAGDITRRVDAHAFDAVLVRTMPPGSLEQVVFRMDLLGVLESHGMPVVNPPRAIETSVDKFLSLARLTAAGLPVPRTFVCQTASEGLAAFDQLGGDAVLKPLFGSEGRGITRIVDRAFAERAFRLLAERGEVLYLQEYIDHPGYDIRVLLIGRQAICFRRVHQGDWRTNLSRGARAQPIEPVVELIELANRASDAVGAPLVGVDLIEDRQGRRLVLEVNAVPGWKATSAALGIDVAGLVLGYLERLVQSGPDR